MQVANPAPDRLLVSVIVPARNEEASLGSCLQSLVEQTGVKMEIIVVDDGSTDRTRKIAESFAGVKVIQDMVMNHIGSEHWLMKDLPEKD